MALFIEFLTSLDIVGCWTLLVGIYNKDRIFDANALKPVSLVGMADCRYLAQVIFRREQSELRSRSRDKM